ncbi:MAG TPA: PDZ domain-containing protein [Terriglobales bacterium]|nr:PDZ domain-containing protein [Terriglobales bacterium]
MRNELVRLLAIMLMAGASYAQQTPTPAAPSAPAAPATPTAAQAEEMPDAKEIQKEVEEARKEAEQAKREADRARREAVREASKAKAAARKAARAHVVSTNRSYLGIGGQDLTPERANALKAKEARGIEVIAVDQDSPAGKAGIRDGDVIVSFDGKRTDDYDHLRRLMHDTAPGKVVKVGVLRNGSPMTFNVTIAKRDATAWAWAPGTKIEIPRVPMPDIPRMDFDVPSFTVLQFSARNGVVVEDLTPQLGEFFGVKDGEGVLVRSVNRGSAAESAGLKAGDVIVRAGKDRITSASDWRRVMREHKEGALTLGIVRDKREQNLTVKLPSTSSDASVHGWPGFSDKDFEHFRLELQKLEPKLRNDLKMAQAQFEREMKLHGKDIERAMNLRHEDFERVRADAEKAVEEATEQLRKLQE